eukprot:1859644-Heterocapsa_arctica.AAC.1
MAGATDSTRAAPLLLADSDRSRPAPPPDRVFGLLGACEQRKQARPQDGHGRDRRCRCLLGGPPL